MIGYVTLEEAKEYYELRFEKVATDEALGRTLQLAFDKIETIDIRNQGAPNKFPRLCDAGVPALVKQAQMLEAYSMAIHSVDGTEKNGGIKSKSIGDYSVTYSDTKVMNVNGVEFANKTAFDIMDRFRRKSY